MLIFNFFVIKNRKKVELFRKFNYNYNQQ